MLFDDVPMWPTFTLYNLSLSLQSCVKTNFPGGVWVIAEISSLGENSASGHCYIELVDLDPDTHRQRAKMRATMWARSVARVFQTFRSATGVDLQAGLTVQVLATLEYSPVFGFSLNITDIDGTYTAGVMAVKRRQTLAQLAKDGVMEMNRSLERPSLPRRIAVISSPTAAGYEDFMKQISGAKERFSLQIGLFEAVMQGEQAPLSIVDALGLILASEREWDVVVIIRGGGAKLDLACFDDYTLASHVAQFPLPVYAGIGHERDSSVVDIVANATLKTPTAMAEFVKSFFEERELALLDAVQLFAQGVRTALDGNRVALRQVSDNVYVGAKRHLAVRMVEVLSIARQFAVGSEGILQLRGQELQGVYGRLEQGFERMLEKSITGVQRAAESLAMGVFQRLGECREALGVMSERLTQQRPDSILERGYVRVERDGGRAIGRSVEVRSGEEVRLRWKDGERRAKIK